MKLENAWGGYLSALMLLLCGLLFLLFSDRLIIRQMRGRIAHIAAPGYSECYRCKMPWKFTESHSTDYGPDGEWQEIEGGWGKFKVGPMGCFPLCEKCWKELKTPEARMPYYRQLWTEWSADGVPMDGRKWEWIEAAVRDGR